MKYTDIPLDNIQLNLSKNRLQPAYWENVNAYAFDNMLQPTLAQTTQYKDNFVIGDDLYSVKNKQLYKNGTLFHDFSNEELTFTYEFDGHKKGEYRLGTDNNLYYNGTIVLQDIDYKSTSLWANNTNAVLLSAKGLYWFTRSTYKRVDIPDFNFQNCIQVNASDGTIYLVEPESTAEPEILSVTVYVKVLSEVSGVKKISMPSTYPMFVLEPFGENTGGGTAVYLSSDDLDYTKAIKYKISASDTAGYFRATPYYWTKVDKTSATVTNDNPLGADVMADLSLVQYIDVNAITASYTSKTVKLSGTFISNDDTSGVVGVTKPISINSVSYKDYGNGIAGFKIVANVYSDRAHEYKTKEAYAFRAPDLYDNLSTTDNGSIIVGDSSVRTGISMINMLSIKNYGNWSIIYQEGVIKYVLYKNKLIALPFIIDDFFIESDTRIQLFSETLKKTFRVNIAPVFELKLIKVGDSIITNSIVTPRIENSTIKNNDFSSVIFSAKYPGIIDGLSMNLPDTLGSAYIGIASDDIWEGATEFYCNFDDAHPLDKSLFSGYNITGMGDIYLGETGTVEYSFSVNNSFTYVKNLEKEYGISEEPQYVLPVTDDIKVLLDYDIFNTYIKVQGFTIKLSVINNEIQSVVTLASLDTDVDEIFTLQGQGYQIINNKIYSFSATAESGLSDQQFIVSCPFKYLGYDDTSAYFWDPLTKNVVCFQGNNQMSILQSMSLLDNIIFSDYDVAHQALVISTNSKTYLKLYNNWMSFNFSTSTSAVFYKDSILLDYKKLVLGGQGTLDIQTGWIYNNTANQPLITVENIFITLLSAGNIDVYIDFLSPDKEVSSMAKHYTNVEYVKVSMTHLLTRAIRFRIHCNKPITGITIAADDKVDASPISNRQVIEI